MMRLVYPVILFLALPLVWLRLQWRSRREPEYGQRQGERFGRVPETVRRGPVWFHTVSAGETIAAAPMIAALAERHSDVPFLVTTMTPTGSQQVVDRLGRLVDHCYAPYDFGFGVRRFFDRVAPRLLVLMETELWPNLIGEAYARGVPVLLVNARLSQRSANGYARLGALADRMLGQVDLIACQTVDHRLRFEALGAPRVEVVGSVKFDLTLPRDFASNGARLARRLGTQEETVWIAASTHPGEDEIVLEAFARVRETHPELKLVLVPRHPVRGADVGALAESAGYTVSYQSVLSPEDGREGGSEGPVRATDVIVGDVMGTLLSLYGLADVAFVGGSFVEVGGHNPIEPALCGVPAISGPHQFNFTDVMEALEHVGSLVTVSDAAALAVQILIWLDDPRAAEAAGAAGLGVIEANRGAQARITQLIEERLSGMA